DTLCPAMKRRKFRWRSAGKPAISQRRGPARSNGSGVASGSMSLPCSTPLAGSDDRPEDRLAAIEHVLGGEVLGDAAPCRLTEREPPRRIDRESDEPVGERFRVAHRHDEAAHAVLDRLVRAD